MNSKRTQAKPSKKTGTKKKLKYSSACRILKLIILCFFIFLPFYYGGLIKHIRSAGRWINDAFITDYYPHYASFDVRIPKGYSVHGVDVSRYQGKINWTRVAAMEDDDVKIDFAFIKATEGLLSVDPYFERNWREAKKAGIRRGAYHYFKPKKSGIWQARFFLQTVAHQKGDLLPVIDVEETGNLNAKELRANLKDFVKQVEKKLGHKPIIYTGYKFYVDNLQGYFDAYPLWIAHYDQPKLKLSEGTPWHFWQHSDRAKVDGMQHITDLNVFNGDEEDLKDLQIR